MAVVRLAWSLSGSFSYTPERMELVEIEEKNDGKSTAAAQTSDEKKKTDSSGQEQTKKDSVHVERAKELFGDIVTLGKTDDYFRDVATATTAALRNLEIVYRGRELNFEENKVLRQAYIDSIRKRILFGQSLKDFIAPVGATAGAAVGGTSLFAIYGNYLEGIIGTISWFYVASIFAIIGFFSYWTISAFAHRQRMHAYIQQDYERTVYYKNYLNRAYSVLDTLYKDIDDINARDYPGFVFPVTSFEGELPSLFPAGCAALQPRGRPDATPREAIRRLMCVYPRSSSQIDECLYLKRINPELWAGCETGCSFGSPNYAGYEKECEKNCPGVTWKPYQRVGTRLARFGAGWFSWLGATKPYSFVAGIGLLVIIAFMLVAVLPPVESGLNITKTVEPHTIMQGQNVTVTLLVFNHGPDTLYNISVSDRRSAGFEDNASWPRNYSVLQRGESRSFSYAMLPNETDTGTFVLDAATANYEGQDRIPYSATSNTPSFTISSIPLSAESSGASGVDLRKTVMPSGVGANQTVNVTITLYNGSPGTLSHVVVTDVPMKLFEKALVATRTWNETTVPSGEERRWYYEIRSPEMSETYPLNTATATFVDSSGKEYSVASNVPKVTVMSH